MKLHVEVIPHNKQRYETVGDWWFDKDGTLQVRVSDMGNSDYEFLIAIHELVEAHLCKRSGISEHEVTAFDVVFEKERAEGQHKPEDEPGYDVRSPYRIQHAIAESIEYTLSKHLQVSWEAYELTVQSLG